MRRVSRRAAAIPEILQEANRSGSVVKACKKYGISRSTFYNWLIKYNELQEEDVASVMQLEIERNALIREYKALKQDLDILRLILEGRIFK
jgi:transposase-like protein